MFPWSILDEFSENLQTASEPPPHALVSENYVALFCNEFLDWSDPPLSRKFIVFPPQNYCKNCNEFFWIGNDPHPPSRSVVF